MIVLRVDETCRRGSRKVAICLKVIAADHFPEALAKHGVR